MHLAFYGHLNKCSGSGPGSNYLLLEELLARGHSIDLYAIEGFVEPQDLARFPNLTYVPTSLPVADRVKDLLLGLPEAIGWLPTFMFNQLRHWLYYRAIERVIAERHARRPYDALLVFDVLMPFRRIETLPCLNWPQSTPLGELEGLRRQRQQMARLSSRALYWGLVLYYRWRVATVRRKIRACDRVICCSTWTRDSWKSLGVPDATALPFALDLARFHPPAAAPEGRAVTFLHLGRIVPRKRIDLLLEGFALLRREVTDARLIVIGRFAYAKGYARLVSPEELPPGVDYRPHIDRALVPELLRSIDVLVQPSENEDFGSAVMEAQASGVPVVIGPTNGTRDYVSERSFFFESYTPRAVADAMRRACDGVRRERAALMRDAREAAEASFSVEALADRVLAQVRAHDRAEALV